VEIKRNLSPRPERGFYNACNDLKPDHSFVIYPGEEHYPVSNGVEAIGVKEFASELEAT